MSALAQDIQSYVWNEDNRLVEAMVSSGDPKAFDYSVFYEYDHAGRRIVEYKDDSSGIWSGYTGTTQRTRHFFNGLTEEVKKVSVGNHTNADFGFVAQEDGENASEWYVYDATPAGASVGFDYSHTLHSNVIKCLGGDGNGFIIGDRDDETVNPNDTAWNETRRVLSFWYRGGFTGIYVSVATSAGHKYVQYHTGTGTNYESGGYVHIYLGTPGSTNWQRFERNIEADLESISTAAWIDTDAILFRPDSTMSYDLEIDDLRFSNSITVEKNVLAGGSIGHIVRNSTINPSTYAATDRWFHYDQVGSVMSVSNNSGNLETRIDQDAFGNVLASWQTGQWASDSASAGWHHNTKELDGDIGLVYMHQRWYLPEVGVFVSRAPYPVTVEHAYSFADMKPTLGYDPDGRSVVGPIDVIPIGVGGMHLDKAGIERLCKRKNPYNRNSHPHQYMSWKFGYSGVPGSYSVLWYGGHAWEFSQGVFSYLRGNDFSDDETGRNSDGSPRSRSGYQEGDTRANDEGYNRGEEDAAKEKECIESFESLNRA